jgi:hypothetical protein
MAITVLRFNKIASSRLLNGQISKFPAKFFCNRRKIPGRFVIILIMYWREIVVI